MYIMLNAKEMDAKENYFTSIQYIRLLKNTSMVLKSSTMLSSNIYENGKNAN
jgi:hypothetical protein